MINALYLTSVRRLTETSFVVISICLFFFDLAVLLVALLRRAHSDYSFWLFVATLFFAVATGFSRYERLRDELVASWRTRETDRTVAQYGVERGEAERIVTLWGVSPTRLLRTALQQRHVALGRPLSAQEEAETRAQVLDEYRDDALRIEISRVAI